MDKPKWKYQIDKEKFYTLLHAVKKVTHHWKLTSEDTSEDWIELHVDDGGKMRKPKGFDDLYSFSPDHRSLFGLTFDGERALIDYDEIAKYEKTHAKEIAEYERLKAKLG